MAAVLMGALSTSSTSGACFKLHRPIEGQIKTIAFKREADGYSVVFSCDLGVATIPPSSNPAIGSDLGLKAFLVTSEGESVAPPQH
jgi:putative transposase